MGGNSSNLTPLRPVSTVVDMARYMGTWYVIGVKPTYFEIGAVNAVEVYTLNSKQEIDIEFTFNPKSPDAPLQKIPQKGFIHDKATNAEWRYVHTYSHLNITDR
jgi:apolipoprotein D and lipocalin family protein